MNTNEISKVGYNPLPTKIDDITEENLRKLIGQSGDVSSGGGLPRLSINHSTEDDDGNSIPRGFFMIGTVAEGLSLHLKLRIDLLSAPLCILYGIMTVINSVVKLFNHVV